MERWRPSFLLTVALAGAVAVGAQPPTFEHVVIDADNPDDPHCKTLGDIDGDGLLDAIVASSSGDGMYWYEYPAWTRHTIRAAGSWTTDMQAGDVDDDGDLDLVIPDSAALRWYENPRPGGDPRTDPWIEHTIGASGADNHDVEIGDVDDDGDLDVVSRRKNGQGTWFWRQATPTSWSRITVSLEHGEGVGLGDLDGDGDLDVAQNGFWSEQLSPTSWVDHTFDTNWPHDVGVLMAHVDGNSSLDIVIGPSESSGRLSWYEASDPVNGPWTEHSIDPSVSFLHTFKAADMDGDGDLDLVTAEMHQSSDPDEVSVYLNDGDGLGWSQLVVAQTGSHNVRVGDVGNDGDLDIFGANWSDSAPNSAIVELWENQSGPLPLDLWQRHVVESSMPWQAVFVDGRDVNGDARPDIVTGGWWYPNPGDLGGSWTRTPIGTGLDNMAVVHDFDGDGDLDILGTDGRPSGEDFSWADNDGSGGFTVRGITHPSHGGDFLQGASAGQVVAGAATEVVLSWHNGGSGTAMFTVPADPTTAAWPLAVISATTNQEAVPIGDVDGDEDIDIHLGSQWLRQGAGGGFATRPGVPLSAGVPDRVVLGDIDGDDDLDVVIGVEFADRLVWGENRSSGGTWVEHEIATDFDYFSVDTADIDGDGDLDVVGGAHLGNGEVTVYENDGSGGGWTAHVVDPGDNPQIDHHDGTRLIDMDLDGDLDILSIGWNPRSLVVYENLAIDGGGGDVTGPRIAAVLAAGDPTRVLVEFDEPVDPASSQTVGNYAISGGVAISAADRLANRRVVDLATSPLSGGPGYTLSVDDVEDLAGNPILPNSEHAFDFEPISPTAGLVGYWPLDEGVGTMTVDRSGSGRHGVLVGGAAWGAGSVSLDGIDDHVDLGAFDVPSSELTIAAWIHADDLDNCSANDCRVLSKATGTAEADHYFMLSTIETGGETRLRFRLKTGGTTTTLVASSGALVEGQWIHAAAVYDGTTMSLYKDGNLVGSTGKSGTVTGAPTVPVWIGGNPPDAGAKPWDGLLDEVRLYDRALSQQEIRDLPGPGSNSIFEDGFESGDTSAWSNTID